jgi:5-methyltetrahydrofolate--homocysteine methyltransferase
MSRLEEIRQSLYDHTLAGHAAQVKQLTEEALAAGMPPDEILFRALIPSLEEVGRRFETGEYFVPEMLVAAKAMQQALTVLRPLLAQGGIQPRGKVMMMTVKGDLHDIGKNLCNLMLEGAGYEVIDLGVNVPPEKMVAAIREHHPSLVGFSALLTTTMTMFKANLDALEKAGLRKQIKVMVGGAPVTQDYATRIGADGYAQDACAAVRLAHRLMEPIPNTPMETLTAVIER